MSDLELKERDGVWYAYGSIGGKRIRKSLGTRDKKRAIEILAQFKATAWKRHTYGEEAVRLFEEAATSYMQQGGEARYLVPIIKYFKGRTIGTIKPAEIRSMALTLYPRHSPATRNRQAVIPARAVINHAHDLGWCGPLKVKMFDVPKSNKHKPVERDWINALEYSGDRRTRLGAIPSARTLCLSKEHRSRPPWTPAAGSLRNCSWRLTSIARMQDVRLPRNSIAKTANLPLFRHSPQNVRAIALERKDKLWIVYMPW
jgi:hypothetical protein